MNSYFRHQFESIIYPLLAGVGLIACLLLSSLASADHSNSILEGAKTESVCLSPLSCDQTSGLLFDELRADCRSEGLGSLIKYEQQPFWLNNYYLTSPCNMSTPRNPAHEPKRDKGHRSQGSHT